jgi:RNA polymerase sigma-70 factor (ECF subfamily)
MNEPDLARAGDTTLRSVGDDPDRSLMERLAAGDAEALDGLFERYGAMAYSVALRITGEPAAAEDVVQDAFLGAWRNADRFMGSRGLARTWLLSIVHHRAIDAIRRRRPASELPDTEAATPDSLTLPDVWNEVARGLDRAAIRAALGTISPIQREAIELAFFSGLTQVEVAARTGAPLGTVKSRMRLGLLGLRRALEEPAAPTQARQPEEIDRG